MRFPRTWCFLLASLPGAVVLGAPAAVSAPAAESAANKAVLEYIRAEMQERRIPGMQIVVIRHGRLLTPASLAVMWTPSTFADGRPAPWALGRPDQLIDTVAGFYVPALRKSAVR